MFYFVIPLRSKHSSKDWNNVVHCFNNTLRSIYNQESQEFRIFVAVHDYPDIRVKTDERFSIYQVDYPYPNDYDAQMMDKFYKKRFLMNEIRKSGDEGFVMFTDADDYVSKRLVSFIKKHETEHGYYMNWGYEYNTINRKLKLAPKFYNVCGTSYIIRFCNEDLPTGFDFEGYGFSLDTRPKKYFFDYSHVTWIKNLKNMTRSLKELPFPGTLYTINTGDNYSLLSGDVGLRRIIIRSIIPSFKPTKKLSEEFALIESYE